MTLPKKPIPKRPFRDSALIYGGMAIVFVVFVAISGGKLMVAIPVAVALFVVATGYAWWKFRQRLRFEDEGESQ